MVDRDDITENATFEINIEVIGNVPEKPRSRAVKVTTQRSI
jgi:hypothetical protein